MQKIKMSRGVTLTFEEGCRKYLENCRQRNLRDGSKIKLMNILFIIWQSVHFSFFVFQIMPMASNFSMRS